MGWDGAHDLIVHMIVHMGQGYKFLIRAELVMLTVESGTDAVV